MRITLVISSLGRGGAERAMSLLANSWAEQGKEISLLTFDHGDAPAYPIHPFVNLRSLGLQARSSHLLKALLQNLRRIRVLRRAIRQSQPDVVISFMDSANVLTLLATRGLGMPIIVSERSDPSLYDIGPVWNGLRRLTYPLSDALVCQTESALALFQTRIKVKGCVIPNQVTVPVGLRQLKKQQGDSGRSHIVAAMGRLVPEKGFDLLLDAFSRVAPGHPEWSLTIVGDGPLRTELQTQAEILKIRERACFLGEVPEPFPVLCAADLFVLSSRFEGFPNALCE